MIRKILSDSSLEMNESLLKRFDVTFVPFTISVGGKDFIDDGSVNIDELLSAMKASPEPVRTACPSTGNFLKAMEDSGADEISVITITGKLSGSYQAAKVAAEMHMKQNPGVKVHVFDSKSAGCGETNVASKINSLSDKSFEEMVSEVEKFIDELKTVFVLETLESLAKNGRITKFNALVGSILKIKPICIGQDGEIGMAAKARGFKNALIKIVDMVEEFRPVQTGYSFYINHTRALEHAEFLKEKILERYNFDEVEIFETKGLTTAYANDGGVVITF